MTLTEFLEARIAEDEEAARFVSQQQDGRGTPTEPWALRWHDEYDLLYVDPARVLAECAAKRAIIELHSPYLSIPDDDEPLCAQCESSGPVAQGWPCGTIRQLALPYADHSDHQQEWRP